MKITKITVTGADDSIDPAALKALSEKYPIVEFGILLSRNQIGGPRFPSMKWLKRLMETSGDFHLSGHICGQWVRDILTGKWPVEEFITLMGMGFFERFDRWQLNTHGQRHKWNLDFFRYIATPGPRGIIFQNDEENEALISAAIMSGNPNVSALFDLSHGAGALPESWPKPVADISCGYAGGLTPENVADQCQLIQQVAGDSEIWIDAETHLRSEDGRLFDLEKCEKFIQNAMPFTS